MPVSNLVYDYIMGSDQRAFPVTRAENLVGLVCLEDVRKVPRQEWDTTRVREIMTTSDQLEIVEPRQDVSDVIQQIARREVSQMPVVEDGRMVGMLLEKDISRWLQLQSGRQA